MLLEILVYVVATVVVVLLGRLTDRALGRRAETRSSLEPAGLPDNRPPD